MRRELREWQKKALEVYLQSLEEKRNSILWEATPGAGKTIAAMRLCLHQLRAGGARKVVIVVPTTHLKLQWARAALEFQIHLDANFGDGQRRLARDYHGVVLTYQQIGNRPELFRPICSNAVTVLDEVHHSGDGLTWGDALQIALQDTSYILCLSGTAFRSDNNPIPFVRYSPAGVSEPDYVYSYATAVEDAVCRPTVFFTYGGDVRWRDGEHDLQVTFNDSLDRIGRTRRLRAALDAEAGWIEPMLQDAHQMLQAIRHDHPEAAALLTASSQDHARALAKVLLKVTGMKPTVVLSEETAAAKRLKEFSAGSAPWLVACNMVSEGVDIPRLRIGVYATTIRTKMYFRQFLGRIVRRTPLPHGVQPAFFYVPADPWLQQLAEEVEKEQRHCIQARTADEWFSDLRESDEPRREKQPPSWQALGSTNSGVDRVITGGGQLSLWQLDEPKSHSSPLQDDEAPPPAATHPPGPMSRAEMKEAIAKEIRQLVTKYHRDTGHPHSHIHAQLNRKQAVTSQKECTEHQLKERLHLLEKMIVHTEATE